MDTVLSNNYIASVDTRNETRMANPPLASKPVPKLDNAIKKDVTQVKDTFERFTTTINKYDKASKFATTQTDKDNAEKEIAVAGLSVVPFFRRFTGIQEALCGKDTGKALARTAIMIANIPEDTRDIKGVIDHIKRIEPDVPHDYQIKFSFFRGTLFEPILKRMYKSNNEFLKAISLKIYKLDKPLYDTYFGKKLLDAIGFEDHQIKSTSAKDMKNKSVQAIKIEGSALSKFIGRALLRVPKLSLLVFGLIEAPSIISAFFSKDNIKDDLKAGAKQSVKSSVNIFATTAGGALLGAALAGRGKIGSLVGLGLGSYIGSKAGNALTQQIDKS